MFVEPRWGSLFISYSYPACAARHWALEFNALGVKGGPASRRGRQECPRTSLNIIRSILFIRVYFFSLVNVWVGIRINNRVDR